MALLPNSLWGELASVVLVSAWSHPFLARAGGKLSCSLGVERAGRQGEYATMKRIASYAWFRPTMAAFLMRWMQEYACR